MAKLIWDSTGSRFYETGIRKGVLYIKGSTGYTNGVVWNGLTAITESPSGADVTDLYADDIKYASYRAVETFGGTIEAYQYPQEFEKCDGMLEAVSGVVVSQQSRKVFGLSYQTQIGSDISQEHGYKIHLIYGATASPTEKAYQTINESPDIGTFSWEFNTNPENIEGTIFKPVSLITISSNRVDSTHLTALENILYGTEDTQARLPYPKEVLTTLGFNPETYDPDNIVHQESQPLIGG